MLKIRLQRTGRKNEPTFRLVLTDSKNSAKSGRFLEVLGNFDSRKGEQAEFKGDRISHWVKMGAQVSDTVHNLLVDKKLVVGKKINKLPKKKAIVKEVVAEVASPAPAATPTVAPAPLAEIAPVAEAIVAEEATPVEVSAPEVPAEEAPVVAPEAPTVVEEAPVAEAAPTEEGQTA